jgi:predicted dehydrogenase
MRVFVVGLGSIGRRHLETLEGLGCEVSGGRLEQAERWRPDAVVIASPTSRHLEGLTWAVEHGAHAYVEKPLAAATDGVATVLSAAARAGLAVAVGYNLRFHPAVEAIRAAIEGGRIGALLSVRAEVGQYLPDWQPERDYRESYAARRELGGGALLTLSHELDLVRWIAGEIVDAQGIATHVSKLETDTDDLCELLLRHTSGTLSSVHVDMLDRSYNRRSRWVGSEGTLAWEWGRPVLLGAEPIWQDDSYDPSATYTAALHDFLDSAKAGSRPRATGADGLRVLEVCETVSRAW